MSSAGNRAPLTRKHPRDFVHVDALWQADDHWEHYYIRREVWVYMDEYRAELTGDQDYCRIIINMGNDSGWIYKRPLEEKGDVFRVLETIRLPLSQSELKACGFEGWSDAHIY